MGKRVEWLRFVMRHGRKRHRQLMIFLAFEAYYQLCALRGYKPRHILDPSSASLKGMPPGGRILMIWPRLPFSIRVLDRIIFTGAHAELVPYTPDAFEAARASGRRVEFMEVVLGELRFR
jgi:hypothetical protein